VCVRWICHANVRLSLKKIQIYTSKTNLLKNIILHSERIEEWTYCFYNDVFKKKKNFICLRTLFYTRVTFKCIKSLFYSITGKIAFEFRKTTNNKQCFERDRCFQMSNENTRGLIGPSDNRTEPNNNRLLRRPRLARPFARCPEQY